MKKNNQVFLKIGTVAALFLVAGCGQETGVAADQKSPAARVETTTVTSAENASPEDIVAAFRGSADSLGLRDESDPGAGVYLYIDETTELLYRLSVHGIDPAFLPEVGPVLKRITDDGYPMIESTIYADAVIWIEAVSVLSGHRAGLEEATKTRIRQIHDAFARHLQEELAR